MQDYKRFNLKMPAKLWEEFYRTYPKRGSRTRLLLDMIQEAIEEKNYGQPKENNWTSTE